MDKNTELSYRITISKDNLEEALLSLRDFERYMSLVIAVAYYQVLGELECQYYLDGCNFCGCYSKPITLEEVQAIIDKEGGL